MLHPNDKELDNLYAASAHGADDVETEDRDDEFKLRWNGVEKIGGQKKRMVAKFDSRLLRNIWADKLRGKKK